MFKADSGYIFKNHVGLWGNRETWIHGVRMLDLRTRMVHWAYQLSATDRPIQPFAAARRSVPILNTERVTRAGVGCVLRAFFIFYTRIGGNFWQFTFWIIVLLWTVEQSCFIQTHVVICGLDCDRSSLQNKTPANTQDDVCVHRGECSTFSLTFRFLLSNLLFNWTLPLSLVNLFHFFAGFHCEEIWTKVT